MKDLNEKDLDAFSHAMTRWQIRTSYELAEKLLGEDATFEEKQKLTAEIFEKKLII